MRIARCLRAEELEQLFLGGLPEEEAQAREEHVLSCASCMEKLKALVRTRDSLADLLTGESPYEPFSSSPVVAHLMQQFKTLRSEPADAVRNPVVSPNEPSMPGGATPPSGSQAPAAGKQRENSRNGSRG